MESNLKPVTFGSNIFCGPAVMSSILGISTDEGAKAIAKIQNEVGYLSTSKSYLDVKGATGLHLIQAFKSFGYTMKHEIKLADSYWSERRKKWVYPQSLFLVLSMLDEVGFYIVMVPEHWIVVSLELSESGNKRVFLCDNHSREPLNVSSSSRLSQSVHAVYSVRKD